MIRAAKFAGSDRHRKPFGSTTVTVWVAGTGPQNVTVAPFSINVVPEPVRPVPVVTVSWLPIAVSVPAKVAECSR